MQNSAPQNAGLSSCLVVLGAFLLGLSGPLMLVIGFIDFWRRPDVVRFAVTYVLGLWPTWVFLIMVYGLLFHRRDGRIVFPPRLPKRFLVANLLITAPVVFVVGFVAEQCLTGLPFMEWDWRAVVAAAVFLAPILLVSLGLRRLFRMNIEELRKAHEKDRN